jgi:hypothetical protein
LTKKKDSIPKNVFRTGLKERSPGICYIQSLTKEFITKNQEDKYYFGVMHLISVQLLSQFWNQKWFHEKEVTTEI